VSAGDAEEILEKIGTLRKQVEKATLSPMASPARLESLRVFGASLEKSFYGFEPDFFQQNLHRIVDDVNTVIQGSIELWPTLVEIAFFEKSRHGLPQTRVANQRH